MNSEKQNTKDLNIIVSQCVNCIYLQTEDETYEDTCIIYGEIPEEIKWNDIKCKYRKEDK